MNVVLLSGGSGKRLWPLSNEIRSKQFIRMFGDGQGGYESMVERMYRQLTGALGQARIVVATGKAQVSATRNQLGDRVSICVEPCRRDTFPAIALAAAYLKYELQAGDEECVVICPADPHVDDSYFQSFAALERLTLQGQANLTLMGIEPTAPSDKYGYIMPEESAAVSRVREFKEKPDVERAKEFISQGALWNAGVFALKLGYLIRRAHELIDFTDYRDLYEKYDSLTKISFDYAVVEHEKDIQVLRYGGGWCDVGEWSTLTGVMDAPVKGDVTLDGSCEGVYAINELDIPILVMGARNMVVAASPDGILIADREKSGGMKPYVEKIQRSVRYSEKSWGTFRVLDEQPGSLTAQLTIRAGHALSLHSHEGRSEAWTIVSGEGAVFIGGEERPAGPGSCFSIPAGVEHALRADTAMVVSEVQLGGRIDVKDKKKS